MSKLEQYNSYTIDCSSDVPLVFFNLIEPENVCCRTRDGGVRRWRLKQVLFTYEQLLARQLNSRVRDPLELEVIGKIAEMLAARKAKIPLPPEGPGGAG